MHANNEVSLIGSSRFKITHEVCATSQGRIYTGTDLITNKRVVIKEAWRNLVTKNICRKGYKIKENFLTERKFLHSLSQKDNYPFSLIKCIDTFDDTDCHYYAMELCESELFDYISKHFTTIKTYSQPETLKWIKNIAYIFYQICQAIDWLHSNGYCHNDLSLENVMMYNTNELTVKVIDLGLAKSFDISDEKCMFKGDRTGKIQYMSPEMYNNKMYNGKANDVYCLGVLLHMMLIGTIPYNIPNANNDIVFKFIMNGYIKQVLKKYGKLTCVNDDVIDLLKKMLQYEKTRISLTDVLKHQFFDVLDEI